MADAMLIAAEKERMLQAIARVGARAKAQIEAASLETAERVEEEMRRRIARSAGPWRGTDEPTWQKIHHERARSGGGYVVMAFHSGGKGSGGRTSQHHVDLYLEHGTKFMAPQPFLWPSASAEEAAHLRRMEAAVEAAMEEVNDL